MFPKLNFFPIIYLCEEWREDFDFVYFCFVSFVFRLQIGKSHLIPVSVLQLQVVYCAPSCSRATFNLGLMVMQSCSMRGLFCGKILMTCLSQSC